MYQSITIMGNLGQDPVMRYMPNGDAVTSFTVATAKKWTDAKTGEVREATLWFRCTAWRKLAETVGQHLTKGAGVLVVGELEQPGAFLDRDGKPRASLEVRADAVRFLPRANGHEQPAQPPGLTLGEAVATGQPVSLAGVMDGPEIPF